MTAIADASVAVNAPTTIPPITTTSNIKLGKALTTLIPSSFQEVTSPIGSLCFLMNTVATSINSPPSSSPGMYPAINKAPIDTPPLAKEYTIKIFEGGMINPVVEDVMLTAAPSSLG